MVKLRIFASVVLVVLAVMPSSHAESSQCSSRASAFTHSSCNCLGNPQHALFALRPTITVVVGAWDGALVDAVLLKIFIAEEVGYPTELIYAEGDPTSTYSALASGTAHIYPEVACLVFDRWQRGTTPGMALAAFLTDSIPIAARGTQGFTGVAVRGGRFV
jgi:hypothetical protein